MVILTLNNIGNRWVELERWQYGAGYSLCYWIKWNRIAKNKIQILISSWKLKGRGKENIHN